MRIDNQGRPLTDEDLIRLIGLLPDALLVCGSGGRVLGTNQQASELFSDDHPIPEHAQQLIPEIEEWGPDGLRIMAETGELDATFDYPAEPLQGQTFLTISVRASSIRNAAGDSRVLLSVRDISDERQMQTRLRELSMTDELTGIPNRRFLRSTLAFEEERASRFDRILFLMFLDIDKFKDINDVFGHTVGDRAIKHFAAILSGSTRKIDTVCRWGGDEFIVLGLCTTADGALNLLHRLLKAVEGNPLTVADEVLPLKVSIGMVLSRYGRFSRTHGDRLISEADALMLKVKEQSGIQYLVGEIGPEEEEAAS